MYDQTRHLWGKLQRLNEERAQMAINDAVYGMQTMIDIYGPMFGLDITKEDTPEIYKLLQDVSCTCDSVTVRAKKHHMRLRPYVYYNEGTLVPTNTDRAASSQAITGRATWMQHVSPPRCSTSSCRATSDSSSKWPRRARSSRRRPVPQRG